TVGSDDADVIRWMIGGKVMRIGTTSGEYILTSSSQNEAVTPSNVRVSRETNFGSAPIKPVAIGQAVIFGARFGSVNNPARALMESSYNFQINGFEIVARLHERPRWVQFPDQRLRVGAADHLVGSHHRGGRH